MEPTHTATVTAFPEANVGLVDAFLRGLPSRATRKVYGQVITAYEAFLGDRDLLSASRRDIEAYRAHLEALGRAPGTVAKHLAALSGVYGFAMDEGHIDKNPAQRVRRPKLAECSPRQAMSPDEVRALLGAIDTTTLVGLRDYAIVVTLVAQGFRVSELLGLSVEHIGEEAGHKVATITGKGGRIARVPLAAAVWAAITTWASTADIQFGPIFVAVSRAGEVLPGRSMSQQALWKRLRLHARRAGISRPVHGHLFRHTAVTVALDNAVPLHKVQDYARHRSADTTRRYDAHRHALSNPSAHVVAGVLGLGAPGTEGV